MIPQSIHKTLMATFQTGNKASFKDDPCYGALAGRSMFTIDCERAQNWLCERFGLVTDDNIHKLGTFVFWFDWNVQLWRVGT